MADDVNELSRVLMERDHERAKGELEKFKSELTMMVAQAKVDIGDAAVQRMSSAIGLLYRSVAVALAILAGLGGVGYFTASSSVKLAIDTKINDWLSFESKGSILKASLEKIRMRVVLDALVTKLARQKVDAHPDPYFSLSELERSRLVAYMQDSETDLSDFRDCARVLSASFGKFGVRYYLNAVDQMLKSVMNGSDFQNEKRDILLTSLKGYPGLYPYAMQVLQSKDAPNGWKTDAFDVVAEFQPKDAVAYAEANLVKEEDVSFQAKMAQLLVNQAHSASLEQWLSSQLRTDSGALSWAAAADTVAPYINGFERSEAESAIAVKRSAGYLFTAIEHGVRLSNCSIFSGKADLCFEKMRRSRAVTRPTSLFRNDAILAEVSRLAEKRNFAPAQLVAALTATGPRQEIYGIQVELGSATLMTKNFGKVDRGSAQGTILLASGPEGPKDEAGAVYISFRASDGRWIRDVVTGYSGFYDAKLRFAFDETSIQAMEMRRYKDDE